jgi:hypothetical protein
MEKIVRFSLGHLYPLSPMNIKIKYKSKKELSKKIEKNGHTYLRNCISDRFSTKEYRKRAEYLPFPYFYIY